MPRLDGLGATRRIVTDGSARVVMVTTFDRDDYLFESLRAGASGFLLKNSTPEDLRRRPDGRARQRAARARGHPPGRRGRGRALPAPGHPEHADRLAELTEREHEVLRLLGRGLSNAEIARELYVGEATVKTHVSRVLLKLDLRDRVQAVVFAYEAGLVQPGDDRAAPDRPSADVDGA